MIIRTPLISGMLWQKAIASSTSALDFTLLHTEVAKASASAVELESMVTRSAFPKLRECPIVPDELHMPIGVCRGSISIPIPDPNCAFSQ